MFLIRPNQLRFELFVESQKLNFGGSILIAFETHLLCLGSHKIFLYAYPSGFSWSLCDQRTITCFFESNQYYCGLKCLLRKFVLTVVLNPRSRSYYVVVTTFSKYLTSFDQCQPYVLRLDVVVAKIPKICLFELAFLASYFPCFSFALIFSF